MAPSLSKKNSDVADPRWWTYIGFSRFERKRKENKSLLDEMNELTEMRATNQRFASLEHDARQPRLAMEVDVQADTKTRERTERAAIAVHAIHGDSCSANRVDPDPTFCTSFVMTAPDLRRSLVQGRML